MVKNHSFVADRPGKLSRVPNHIAPNNAIKTRGKPVNERKSQLGAKIYNIII